MKQATILMMILIGQVLWAQMERPENNRPELSAPALKYIQVGDVLESRIDGWFGDFNDWASSFLPAEGQRPVWQGGDFPNEDEEDYARYEFSIEVAQWTSMYAPQRAWDGDPTTAWCEGVPGSGEGEVLLVQIDPRTPMEIFSGFGRSERLHRLNGRPKDITLFLLAVPQWDVTQMGMYYDSLEVVASMDVSLDDYFGYQEIPAFDESLWDGQFALLGLRINSVYPGESWEDTLISEIRHQH